MKIGGIDIIDFIEQVPVLRLFAKNIALSGGLAFIIQDFLIPLYADYIFPIIIALLVLTTISLIYWNFNKKTQYKSFSHSVISDENDDFAGPLAGVYAALKVCQHSVLLVAPCDSPFISTESLQCLIEQREKQSADIAVAFDGERIHPVFMAIKSSLQGSLKAYLASGERKIDRWFEQHDCIKVDLSSNPDIFLNINTLEQLAELDTKL